MPRPFGITYEVIGEDVVQHNLLNFGERAVDASPALKVVADLMRGAETELFDVGGSGWAPLADSTVEQKAREGLDPRILHATLALRDSLTVETDPAHVEIITNDELIFGTSDPKAGFHQTGTSNMPARPPLDFAEEGMRAFTREIQRFLVEGDQASILGAGGGNVPWGLAR